MMMLSTFTTTSIQELVQSLQESSRRLNDPDYTVKNDDYVFVERRLLFKAISTAMPMRWRKKTRSFTNSTTR
jgi:hypothetical protein